MQLPEVVACIDYNFKDMDLFGTDLQNFLENKRIFVVQKVGSIIKVIFSTSVNSIDFTSYGTYLGLNNTEGNDFFEVLNFNTFRQMNKSLDFSKISIGKVKSLNFTDLRAKGIDSLPTSFSRDEVNYAEFCLDYMILSEKYQQLILSNLTSVITSVTPADILSNRLSMLELPTSYEFNNVTSQIILTNNIMQIFTLPIPLGFDYVLDYNIVMNNNTKFFFLFVQNPDSIQIIDSFYMNILFSMMFSFISVCFLNFIIWVVIGSCYYFFFKAILAPLKKINKEFKDLIFIKEKNIDHSIRKEKKTIKRNEKDEVGQSRFIETWESNFS
jgi:hypothetical protein